MESDESSMWLGSYCAHQLRNNAIKPESGWQLVVFFGSYASAAVVVELLERTQNPEYPVIYVHLSLEDTVRYKFFSKQNKQNENNWRGQRTQFIDRVNKTAPFWLQGVMAEMLSKVLLGDTISLKRIKFHGFNYIYLVQCSWANRT